MADSWSDAAKRIAAQGLITQQQKEAAVLAAQQRQEAERAARQAAHEAMDEAIVAAVPALTRFFAKRGAAAQELLAACGNGAFVLLGYENGGGYYWSVYFGGQGLRREDGEGGDYNRRPRSNRQATPQEAVEAFAYHGAGRGDPKKVRDIVNWLTQAFDRRVEG